MITPTQKTLNTSLADYLDTVPINQETGLYQPGLPCCVGAHLAHYLKAGIDFLIGADAWAKAMNATRAHAILLLRAAGAPRDPFSADPWPLPPAEVFRKIAKEFETLPPLNNTDLSGIDFSKTDLSNTNLNHTNLSHAELFQADLSRADLRHANLKHTDLSEADLSRADLRHADLNCANLKYANLSFTNLAGANLSGTNLNGANLEYTSFKDTCITGTILDNNNHNN